MRCHRRQLALAGAVAAVVIAATAALVLRQAPVGTPVGERRPAGEDGDAAAEGAPVTTESFLDDLDAAAEERRASPAAPADGSASEVGVAWSVEAEVDVLAEEVVEQYRGVPGASCAASGYLDLKGDVWGAVIRGGSWVDVTVSSALDADGTRSTARVVRLLPDGAPKP